MAMGREAGEKDEKELSGLADTNNQMMVSGR